MKILPLVRINMTLDKLLIYTEGFKSRIRKLDLDEQDVRHSFYALMYSSLHTYYIGRVNYKLYEFIGKGDVHFESRILDFKEHIVSLYDVQKFDILENGYNNNLNRNIFSNTWTTFELSISLIFKFITTPEEYDSIILNMNHKINKKILPVLDGDKKKILLKELKKSTFIPLNRKFNQILKRKQKCYKGDLKKDREFLVFMSKLRNSILHSNGIYYGKEYSYKFKNVRFKFVDGEIFQQKGTYIEYIYFDLAVRLIDIFNNLINCVSDVNFIEYPEDQ